MTMLNDKQPLAAVAGLCVALALAMPLATAHPEGEPWGKSETAVRQAANPDLGENVVFSVEGAGFFHALEVVKRGGINDQTLVTVEMDGRPSMDFSFAMLGNPMRWLDTPDMVANARKAGDTGTMTLWFRAPIEYRSMLRVNVYVGEDGISDLNLRVLYSVLEDDADHEDHNH
jgi:hypothetical protein